MSDENARRNAIESLIHPRPTHDGEKSKTKRGSDRRSERSNPDVPAEGTPSAEDPRDSAGVATHDPLTGLYQEPAWSKLMAWETARVERYRHPAVVLQLEVSPVFGSADAGSDSGVLPSATELASVVRTSTRAADSYAFIEPRRIQGILVETDIDGARSCADRIRRRFFSQARDTAVTLRTGMRTVEPDGGVRAALRAAEAEMYATSQGIETPRESVRAALIELEGLRDDGLIDEAEYTAKRAEVLRRL